MPPVPPLITSTVAIDRNGNGWLYEPGGTAQAIGLVPLGSTNPGTTPPANPQLGWLWWDSGVNELKVWNGTAWIASAGGGGGGIGEPTTAGNWLRTNTSTWVQGLPLSGGVLSNTNNWIVRGVLDIYADDVNAGAYIETQNWATYGLHIDNRSNSGVGFYVENHSAGASGTGLTVHNYNADSSGIIANAFSGNGLAMTLNHTATGSMGLRIDTAAGVTATSGYSLSIVRNDTERLRLDNAGLWLWDGAAIQNVTMGAADSGGTGFRALRVPN